MELWHKQTYGIDISDHSIELLGIRKKVGRLTVATAGRVEIASGVVHNGQIQQPDEFVRALQRLVGSAGIDRHGDKRIILAVPESQIYLYAFTVPAEVSAEHVGESVQYMAEETLPLSFNQVYHDYQILSRDSEGTDVLYVACPKPIIDTLQELTRKAGLNPLVIEPESAALARAIIPPGPVAPTMLADIGSRSTTITIYDRHGIRFSYTLPVAGHAFTKAVMDHRGVSIEEAVRLKRERLLDISKSDNEIREPLDQIVERMSMSIHYYEQKVGFAVTQILLAGGSSLLPGITEYIHHRLRLPVSVGQPLRDISYDRSLLPDERRSIIYSTVTGLALRGVSPRTVAEGINFLRHEEKHHRLAVGDVFHRHAQARPRQKQSSIAKSRPKGQPDPKRMRLLLWVFLGLIVVFFLVLWLRPNG